MFLFEGDFGRVLHTGDFRCALQSACTQMMHDHMCWCKAEYMPQQHM